MADLVALQEQKVLPDKSTFGRQDRPKVRVKLHGEHIGGFFVEQIVNDVAFAGRRFEDDFALNQFPVQHPFDNIRGCGKKIIRKHMGRFNVKKKPRGSRGYPIQRGGNQRSNEKSYCLIFQ
ncbi:MAG TPA: hypothetical protein VHE34_21030 [Puia sp.]|uniref:hypothetical protein n=1 Tax=Puia sp. TaxID=2045100 RepID=UPI002C971DB7|nr:hypothetical protein [Puia sp.]HVU97727.1 hypothetical protein [Puia sp.]